MSGLTRKDAEDITKAFLQDYPAATRHITFIFRKTAQELFAAGIADIPSTAKGFYASEDIYDGPRLYRSRVYVVLENVENRADFSATLRHETLGHFGINTFSTTEKSALLHSIINSRNDPSLELIWEAVEDRYPDKSIDVQAEEVFARVFEHLKNRDILELDRDFGFDAFRETCIDRTKLLQMDDLLHIASMVAQGLHDGSRTQQHFPQDDALVFATRIQNILSRTTATDISAAFCDVTSAALARALTQATVTLDWSEIEHETIMMCIGKLGQKPDAVLQFLLENSPGAVTIEEQLALRGKAGELGPQMEIQFARAQRTLSGSEFTP